MCYPFIGIRCLEPWLFLGNLDSQKGACGFFQQREYYPVYSSCSKENIICFIPRVAKFLNIGLFLGMSKGACWFSQLIVKSIYTQSMKFWCLYIQFLERQTSKIHKDYALFLGLSVPGESLGVPQACLRCLQLFSTLLQPED